VLLKAALPRETDKHDILDRKDIQTR
jgi:hypothetical protein